MMKGVLVALVVIACPLLWIMIIVPLIAKCFRAPYKIGAFPFHRRNQSLSRWQSFWFAGVLGWGGAVFLFTASLQYFDDFSKPTVHQLLRALVIYLVAGGLLSLWIFPRHTTKRPNPSSSS